MPKIAVLGANGQVGAEVCLLLRQQSGIEVVPICRNRQGSAFLRYHGLACRHGLVTDPAQAAQLLGDCDAVANFALGSGRPAEARRQNALLIENSTHFAPASAKIIYFSTMSVYGDPSPEAWIRWRGAYGREKIRCEHLQRRMARRYGREAYILRLGHVCGELQNISLSCRDQIAAGPIVLAGDGSQPSNTVQVATIVDAIQKIVAGAEQTGTYDLMCQPSWSWRQVYQHEAEASGQPLRIENGPQPTVSRSVIRRIPGSLISLPKRMLAALLSRPGIRELILRCMAHLPAGMNEKLQAAYYKRRAAADIAELNRRIISRDSFTWVPMGKQFLKSLSPTSELLRQPAYQLPPPVAASQFPADMPLAATR